MTTSGSYDFSQNRNELISRALRIMNVIEAGEVPTNETIENCSEALNAMVKAWQAAGYHLWTTKEVVLYLTVAQAAYNLGSASTDHATLETDAQKTEIAVAAVLGAGTIEVDSAANIANGDEIGVQQDDGTLHWTTVNGAPAGNVVTLTDVLTAAAAVDNFVYSYTTDVVRPLRLTNVRRRGSDGNDVPILMVSRQEYQDTPNKTSQGKTTMCWYDPERESLGTVTIWVTPETVQDRLVFTAHLPIQDFDAATDTQDLPQEWINAITWGLAQELSEEYSVPDNLTVRISRRASAYRGSVRAWDQEETSLFMQPEPRWR